MTEKAKVGAPEKPAIVAPGRTVYTKRGVAYHPAPITSALLRGGPTEFYKLLNAGVLKREISVTKNIAPGAQISMDMYPSDKAPDSSDSDPDSPDAKPDSSDSDSDSPDKEQASPDKEQASPDADKFPAPKSGVKRKKQ